MTINLSHVAENFQNVVDSFSNNENEHANISIIRDSKNHITGCSLTLNKNERATLKEINEFANICFQQYNPEDAEAYDNINSIRASLQVIRDNVENKDRGCCGLGYLWFLIRLGSYILSDSDEIIVKISNLAQNIIPTKKEKTKEKEIKEPITSLKSVTSEKPNKIKEDYFREKENLSERINLPELNEVKEEKTKEMSEIDVLLADIENAPSYNNPEVISTANFLASRWYEKEGKNELAFKYLNKSCEQLDKSDLKALTRLGKCHENGELGQKRDRQAASKAYDFAVNKCRDSYELSNELLTQCKNVLRCHPPKYYSYEKDYCCNAIVVMAKNSFELDISSIIIDNEVRGQLYFAAGNSIKSENHSYFSSKERLTSLANKLMLLSSKDGNPDAMSWLGTAKQPGSEDWFFEAAEMYKKTHQNKKAIEHYEKSAHAGNLEAITLLSTCFQTGTLGQKLDLARACKYQLNAAKIHFKSENHELFLASCQKALRFDQKTAIVDIILTFKLDISTILEKEDIKGPWWEIHKAYINNINQYLSDNELEKALEQCRYSLHFGSLTPAIVLTLIEKYKLDLAELVPAQKERAKLYFEAAQLSYKQNDFDSDLLDNIELFLKAADEGSIDAMLKLASIYTKAKKDELAFDMWIKSVKLGSIEAAEQIIKTKGNLNDIFETPEERASILVKLASSRSQNSEAVFFYEKACEEGSPEAMEKLGKAFLATSTEPSFYISESYRKQNTVKSKDDLDLTYDEKKGSKLLLDAAKRYEEIEQKKKAFEIYLFLAEKFSEIEILERLALCFENGELEQKIDLNKAGNYYCKIAEIYNEQIGYQYGEETLTQRQASLKACLKAFMLDSNAAIEMLLKNIRDQYKNLFNDEMKDMIAKKTAKFLDSYISDPFCVEKEKVKSREIAGKFAEIEKKLGLNRDKCKF